MIKFMSLITSLSASSLPSEFRRSLSFLTLYSLIAQIKAFRASVLVITFQSQSFLSAVFLFILI
uniref:Uncharacterized protein n=1 Tax=Myoviridae sp. ctBtT5 TaxID=2825048 RepID=A0A8S5PY74_9CAUD|nr:MAG TPA: hypothetical protein [Caudoviricetes sp.]DAE11990.1 MAG TPA: hypothetical protein [Myoviridae sp. ctBtT5]